jgi:hypothetical protein
LEESKICYCINYQYVSQDKIIQVNPQILKIGVPL